MGKSPPPVSLHLHKNAVERRRKKGLRSSLTRDAAILTSTHDVRAYALVAITADGKGHAHWDTGSILPMWAFPETVAAILRRSLENSGVDEDWKPSLPSEGSMRGM